MQENDIYEKNLSALKSGDAVLHKKVMQYISDMQEQLVNIKVEYLADGEPVLSVEFDQWI